MSLCVFSKHVDSWGIGKQAILIDHLSRTFAICAEHTQFGSMLMTEHTVFNMSVKPNHPD